jgi:membrane protein DedA with SNARE-associated domain
MPTDFLLDPGGMAMWTPLALMAVLFLGTFVLEDVAAVGGGLLVAAGSLGWAAAYWPCFLGIWLGDAGLYAVARGLGRDWFQRSPLARHRGRVERSERWFAAHGTSILIFSRLCPGARLPTYLAAGFLKLPLPRFLAVTALAWTAVVIVVVQSLGQAAIDILKSARWSAAILGAALVAALLLSRLNWRRLAARLARWRHWEFWPAWAFYPPVVAWCLWLATKHRSLTLPTAANPGMFTGGIVGESKSATLNELLRTSPEHTAAAGVIHPGSLAWRLDELERIRDRHGIGLPFILKPDIGQRGDGVKLIRDLEQARAYLAATPAPLVVQRYAPGPHEAGIFYYRLPHEKRGRIFAVTLKTFPTLTGDGRSTVEELIWRDARARFLADVYLKRLGPRAGDVLAAGESLRLVEAGNHCQGCIFTDGARLITPALEARIDTISRRLRGFYIGRYDIRFGTEDGLMAGENFQIIELNGAAAEATSIYDSRHSVWAAWRTLFRQWELVFAIGAANRARGHAATHRDVLWREWRQYAARAASYPVAD